MKKRVLIISIILFAIFFIVTGLMSILGFGYFAVASIPYQDIQYVPAATLQRQQMEILIGQIVMFSGIGLFIVNILAEIVFAIIWIIFRKRGNNKNAEDI